MLWWTLRKVNSGKWSKVREGIGDLARSGDPRATAVLTSLLDCSSPSGYFGSVSARNIQFAAAEELAKKGIGRGVERLVQFLPEQFVGPEAAKSLEVVGWRPTTAVERVSFAIAKRDFAKATAEGSIACAPLVEIAVNWSDGDGAADALVKLGDKQVIAQVVSKLVEQLSGYYGFQAARRLGGMRAKDAVDPLVTVLHGAETYSMDQDSTRAAAIEALGEIGDRRACASLAKALSSYSERVREAAAETLPKLLDPTNAPLLAEAASSSEEAASKAAISVLERTGLTRCFVQSQIQGLTDKAAEVRRKAVQALGNVRDSQALGPLILTACLKDDDSEVRKAAPLALHKIDPNWKLSAAAKGAVPEVIDALRDTEAKVRRQAVSLLNDIADRRAVGPLIVDVCLRDPSAELRKAAIDIVEKIDPQWKKSEAVRGALPSLLAALQEKNEVVRQQAASLLGRTGDSAGLAPLIITSLEDPSLSVRKAAVDALRAIDPSWENSEAAQRATPKLLEALKDKREYVRQQAARMLSKVAGSGAVAPLLASLDEQSAQVSQDICGALASLGDHATPVLIDKLLDTKAAVRRNAALTLSMTGTQSAAALPNLIKCLSDSEQEVRMNALKAIGALGPAAADAIPHVVNLWKDLDRDLFLSIVEKVADARAIDPVLQILFESPSGRRADRITRILLALATRSSLNQQLIEWTVGASGYQHKYRGYKYDAGYITLEVSDEAIRSLCAVKSVVTSNILHLVAQKKDVSVTMDTGCSSPWEQKVSFEPQRAIARGELTNRGSPPYDSSAYLPTHDTEALKKQTQAALEDERRRRYQQLLALVKKPREEMGEDKWTYYKELAEYFRTIEVFRLLANDLARYRYIKPSEISSFVALMIKVGQNFSDSAVQGALAVVSGPWPQAHKDVVQGIKRARLKGQAK